MKCRDLDFVQCAEGHGSVEMEKHVAECPACREESARFSMFLNEVIPVYKKGKMLAEELDHELFAMDMAMMKHLPVEIIEKVRALKESSLTGQLKKIIGEGRENTQDLIESILHPKMEALHASPKDITKTKKAKPKQKKTLPEKRQAKKRTTNVKQKR